jgi:hypothetical protein
MPFCTSAITPQPTEQWVQTLRIFFRVFFFAATTFVSALASCISVSGKALAIAAPPTARPECCKNVRRSSRGLSEIAGEGVDDFLALRFISFITPSKIKY